MALSVGLSSVRFGLNGKWESAVWCIIIAGFLDMMDGRVARFLRVTSSFGVELDSLSDMVNFGVVPSLLLYVWCMCLPGRNVLLWGSVLFFTTCTAIRLAKFNLVAHKPNAHNGRGRHFFLGMPAPVGAAFAIMPIVIEFDIAKLLDFSLNNRFILAPYLVVIGFFMASRIPTFSVKFIRISTEYVWMFFLLVVIILVLLYLYPWYFIPFMALIYLVSVILSVIVYYKSGKSFAK
ncbi:CDP-diacylglycerol--serine O-phosphatidyltransferase [Candidatus Sneabacter namystus]|uniref:CDP-diacylglycerol--serine O-phosphatidyltransferase n=2 Tax=Candidatus Sneabacter namystus TaxID=2601646 RepID=A0A5C0UJA6_9RICK|nr:CDP-diacylglycerol--serine O-phosphatidyltransferase [Candidatus Sneabacter namystus]